MKKIDKARRCIAFTLAVLLCISGIANGGIRVLADGPKHFVTAESRKIMSSEREKMAEKESMTEESPQENPSLQRNLKSRKMAEKESEDGKISGESRVVRKAERQIPGNRNKAGGSRNVGKIALEKWENESVFEEGAKDKKITGTEVEGDKASEENAKKNEVSKEGIKEKKSLNEVSKEGMKDQKLFAENVKSEEPPERNRENGKPFERNQENGWLSEGDQKNGKLSEGDRENGKPSEGDRENGKPSEEDRENEKLSEENQENEKPSEGNLEDRQPSGESAEEQNWSEENSKNPTTSENSPKDDESDSEGVENGKISDNDANSDKKTAASEENEKAKNDVEDLSPLWRSGKREGSLTEELEEEIQRTLNDNGKVLDTLEDGQSTTLAQYSAREAETTEIQVKAKASYKYADYGLGTGETRKYEVTFEDPETGEEKTVDAYCIQPKKLAPGDCVCKIEPLSGRKLASKVIYYGTEVLSEPDSFWNIKYNMVMLEPGLKWIITHIAAAKASGDPDWDYRANAEAKKMANELIEFAETYKGSFPDAEVSFSKTELTAYIESRGFGDVSGPSLPDNQRTPTVTFRGSPDNTVVFELPKNVSCWDADSDSLLSVQGGGQNRVEICGGTSFYFTAPLGQAEEVSASFKITVHGSIKKTYQTYKLTITYGSGDYQNLGLILGSAVPAGEREASLTVQWLTAGDLHIEKQDSVYFGQKLAGAVFHLLDGSGAVVKPSNENAITGDIDASGRITVRADGCADVKNIPVGSYTLREIAAPVGYRISSSDTSVRVKPGESASLIVPNEQVAAGIRIRKFDAETKEPTPQGNGTFENAKFRIVTLQDCRIGGTSYTSGSVVYDGLSIKRDGYGETPLNVLTEGRYRLEEFAAPAGYLVGKNVEFTITKEDHGKRKDITDGEVEDPPVRGGVKIKKVDKDTKTNIPQGDATLAGARFEIISLNEGKVQVNGVKYGRDQVVHTLITRADGTAETDPRLLPCGDYAVREASGGQPKGYLWNKENYREFSITRDNNIVDLSGDPMEDPAKRGGVKLRKVDAETGESHPQGNATLAGARFEILNLSKNPVWVNDTVYEPGQAVYTLITDEEGIAQTDARLLPWGRYAVREAADGQPAGYLWNEKNYREFSVDRDGEVADLSGDPLEDPVIRGGVRVSKCDGESGESHPLGAAALENTEIAIYNDSRAEVSVAGQMYQPGEIVYVLYTDKEGYAQTPDNLLPYGAYRLVEVTPPEGYQGADGSERGVYERRFIISQNGEMVDQTGPEDGIRDLVNRGDIALRKINADTQRAMAGVQFRLTSVTTKESHVFMTDANGFYSTSASYTPHTHNTNGGKLRDGLWFGLRADGTCVEADDSLGALPYDTYRIEELPGENNRGMVLFSDTCTVTENKEVIEFGTVENKEIAIGTTAKDGLTGSHYQAATEGACIVDTVFYQNLDKGVSYTLKGTLINRADGKAVRDAQGNTVSAEKTFRPAVGSGSVDVEFTFDASDFGGMAVVVFEELYQGKDKLAEHKDIGDESQTIRYPQIGTRAADAKTATNVAHGESEVTLIDTVSYWNLQVGRSYRLTGTLMVKETGEAYVDRSGKAVTAAKIFIPEKSSGTVDVVFTFDGVPAAGKTLVAFEELERGGQTYAVHADIHDEGQTVYFPAIGTTAQVEGSQERITMAAAPLAITDTVAYSNVKPGQEYRLVGTLMVKSTKKPLEERGRPVTAEKKFVPGAASGTVDVRFVFDGESLAGNQIVVFEKEVLGFYISGHPLEEYEEQWRRRITHVTTDFLPPEDGEEAKVRDGERAVVGGMITGKTIKSTKNNKMMAFITVEDLAGSVEVIVFPRDYERNAGLLNVDDKVYVSGRVAAEEDRASRMILERITPFDTVQRELWIQFADMQEYEARESELYRSLMDSEGSDRVILYLKKEKKKKILPVNRNVKADQELLERLYGIFGEKNVKAVKKYIENTAEMN